FSAIVSKQFVTGSFFQLGFGHQKGARKVNDVEILVSIVVIVCPANSGPNILWEERVASGIEVSKVDPNLALHLCELDNSRARCRVVDDLGLPVTFRGCVAPGEQKSCRKL
ncbi:MAG: hypothetical protein ABGX22_04715, partial [Pirellulaceae bacterium]